MKDGDLANSIVPRFLFCWENLAAYLPSRLETYEKVLTRTHRWTKAVAQWDLNPMFSTHVWDLWQRYDIRCDVVVTTRPQSFSDVVWNILDEEDIPIKRVLSMESHVLARRMTSQPDVAKIFFGDPKLQFAFGPKGVYVNNGLRDFHPITA